MTWLWWTLTLLWWTLEVVAALFMLLVLFYAIVQPHTLIDPFRPGKR